jgi:hypothetical protein
MENSKAFKALEKIEVIINEVRDTFPSVKKDRAKISLKEVNDPVKILKRVGGIITNYTEQNATRKLSSLLEYLGGISKENK